MNGLLHYVLEVTNVKANKIIAYLTNKDVKDIENYVSVDLKKLREKYDIKVESTEQLSSDILEKINKPQEFMINAQLNQDNFEKVKIEESVQ